MSLIANPITIKIFFEKGKKDYNEISKFLRYGNGIKEYLKNSKDTEPLALAKLLVED